SPTPMGPLFSRSTSGTNVTIPPLSGSPSRVTLPETGATSKGDGSPHPGQIPTKRRRNFQEPAAVEQFPLRISVMASQHDSEPLRPARQPSIANKIRVPASLPIFFILPIDCEIHD